MKNLEIVTVSSLTRASFLDSVIGRGTAGPGPHPGWGEDLFLVRDPGRQPAVPPACRRLGGVHGRRGDHGNERSGHERRMVRGLERVSCRAERGARALERK